MLADNPAEIYEGAWKVQGLIIAAGVLGER